MSAENRRPEAAQEISHADPAVEPEIEQHSRELAGIHPEALATMTAVQGNLVAAEAAADERVEKEAHDWAAIEQAGIDEPVNHAEPRAELEPPPGPRPTRTRTSNLSRDVVGRRRAPEAWPGAVGWV